MKPEQKSLRIGMTVILFSVILRCFSGGLFSEFISRFSGQKLSAMLLFAGTGQVFTQPEIKDPSPTQPPAVLETEPPPTPQPTQPPVETEPPVQAVFSPTDSALIHLTNYPGYDFDLTGLITKPLEWNLKGEEPTVLILHSHTCESYENTEGYRESGSYRTTDGRFNMVSIGAHLAQILTKKGISVIHDTTVHDAPSYNAAYTLSRKTAQGYLEKYPSIRLVLDLHRDAYEDGNGNQVRNTVTLDGVTTSRLMLVAGTNAYGEGHTGWQENLSVGLKLQTVLERLYPGLCRPLALRSSAFNQDLSPGALLVEVGTAGDTRQDALNAAAFLAEGIAALAYGSA